MKSLPIILSTLIIALTIAGCATDECLQNSNALPLAGFYNSSIPDQKVGIDSLEVYGLGAPGDSILSRTYSAINELYLPFKLNNDTTAYVFRYLHKDFNQLNLTDTLRFIYSRQPRFVSTACGASYVFDMDSIYCSHNLIDSVTCPAGEITNMAVENLHIYFRIADN